MPKESPKTKNPAKMAKQAGLPMVAGSDAHTPPEIGMIRIDAEGDILDAIKKGKVEIIRERPPTMLMTHARGMIDRKILKKLPR